MMSGSGNPARRKGRNRQRLRSMIGTILTAIPAATSSKAAAINLGKHREDRREKCAGGERASEEPAAAVRPNRHDSGADHCQRDEDAKVGNRDQPSEVVAEPEGPVRIEEMLAKEDGTDF